ncbi:MFS transporter [Bacillus sp. B-jedd]|uniref:MFS transporter n=1 Tax=Bacillus sp. B-jedd TaxID=1476857 RepID=UPI00051554BD|nr:MFS transporter [Bacillus sp. B-jedd]CEG26638.1 efflux transporter [Bacillus sp. B-jedd]
MKNNIFAVLKNRSFRSLFGAQVFSDLGNWLDFIAIQVVVAYHWGLGEGAIASVIIAMGLPWVIIGPFAGVFVERLPKKAVMITSLVLKFFFVAGLYFSPNFFILLLFVLLKGTAAALYDPARQSTIRSVVPEHELPQAVTLSQLSVNSTKIIGPALGAAIISFFGVKSPFLFEMGGFLIGLLFLFMLPKIVEDSITGEHGSKTKDASFKKQLNEGIQHIFDMPLLKISVILSAAAFFIIFLYDGLFVFIAKEIGFNGEDFGLLVSAVGVGSVAGSLLLGSWTGWKSRPVQLMAFSSLVSGLLIVGIGLGGMKIFSLAQWGWMAGAFALGLLGSSQSIPYGYVLQSQTPSHMMARVSAAASSIQTFSMLIAPAVGAMLAKMIGVPVVLIWAGVLTTQLGFGVLSFRSAKSQTHMAKAKG